MTLWHLWRHPRPRGAEGRCIGAGTDLPVDPRRVRRAARRIDAAARRAGLPRRAWTSPLTRCRAVARHLKALGWTVHVDPALAEIDWGRWDGRPWMALGAAALDAWCADFTGERPGGGETVAALLTRVAPWPAGPAAGGGVLLTHGGWLSARAWLDDPRSAQRAPGPADWPAPPAWGRGLAWDGQAAPRALR